MKKKIILSCLIIILGIIGCFGYRGITKHAESKKIENSIQSLPAFSFYTLDDKPFSRDSLKAGSSLIVFYFNPDCDHCQYEASQLVSHAEQFIGIPIMMVSTATTKEVKSFYDTYQLNKLPDIKMLLDKQSQFEHYFGKASFPTALVYAGDWQLKKKYNGEIKIEAIIDCLH